MPSITLRCVNWTPFGKPVVPDEHRISATASSVRCDALTNDGWSSSFSIAPPTLQNASNSAPNWITAHSRSLAAMAARIFALHAASTKIRRGLERFSACASSRSVYVTLSGARAAPAIIVPNST